MPSSAPHAVLGFIPDVPRYMRPADFFIGKPGPGSISEAVHCGLPVVTVLNAWTMQQERYDPQWVADHGLRVTARTFRGLHRPVMDLLSRLDDYRQRVRAMPPNRAVFEIVRSMERLLGARPQACATREAQLGHDALPDCVKRRLEMDAAALEGPRTA